LIVSQKIDSFMEQLTADSQSPETIQKVVTMLKITTALALKLNLWRSQNRYFSVGRELAPAMQEKAAAGSPEAKQWLQHFTTLGNHLKVRIG
jgi:hypothetical protein